MGKNNAKMIDLDLLIDAGIDPKTGLPIKATTGKKSNLKVAFRKGLRIKDEQQAVNRYVWKNLPSSLNGQLLERILYYKGQAAFFYMEEDDSYYFLPYALRGTEDGTIDVYGRFMGITPLPFYGSTSAAEGEETPWIADLVFNVLYDIEKIEENKKYAVLLSDYSKQISQTVIPRAQLQETIIDAMSECFPMARTSLLANSGIRGMQVATQDEGANVEAAGLAVANCALTGQIYVPIVEAPSLTEMTGAGTAMKAEEYLLYMQSLDNERLSWYGLDSNGVFQKKAHMLQSENDMNASNCNLIYQDGLELRKEFCERINKLFGLNVSVEENETMEEKPEMMEDKEEFIEKNDEEGGEE